MAAVRMGSAPTAARCPSGVAALAPELGRAMGGGLAVQMPVAALAPELGRYVVSTAVRGARARLARPRVSLDEVDEQLVAQMGISALQYRHLCRAVAATCPDTADPVQCPGARAIALARHLGLPERVGRKVWPCCCNHALARRVPVEHPLLELQ